MDLITKAMEEELHLCKDKNLEQQSWKQFTRESKDKQIFIFGMGGGMDYFLRCCCDHMRIAGVIDNDKKRQNQKLGWCCAEAWQTEYEDIEIQSPDVLKNYQPENVVILITSIKYYSSMLEQLRQMKITNGYVLLMMEANARKALGTDAVERKSLSELREEYQQWCCQQSIVENKIVMSYGEYGGHAKYITRQLLKQNKELDIVWLVREEQVEAPDNVRLVPQDNWKRYLYEMETAKIWLYDITVPDHIVKRYGQIYIQAKHWSSITLKKFYLDDMSSCISPEIENWIKRNGEMMDYLLTGSELDEKSCRSGFAFQGEAIRVGSARSDILFENQIKEKVYDRLGLNKDAKVLLYAPTYRQREFENGKSMSISLNLTSLLHTMSQKFGGEWYLLVRLHPWLGFEGCGLTESKRIINVGGYPDSEELVAASDAMVTDYSSIMFEEAFVKRPVFLYAPDRKEYIDGERGLLIDYDTLPFPIAESNEELSQRIQNFEIHKYEEEVTKFLESYGVHEDGHASERAAGFILGLLR
ncbi:CDP-ribitol:poly(ribitol phosphate) ribitol phosphotransferase [Lachnospiraceae bacterium KM106-2]|nr:CDP-ribitol:poly(ribitol phosphate) ribitol phosphotransferase [Lachnospiraceae bacterium KM106-2]